MADQANLCSKCGTALTGAFCSSCGSRAALNLEMDAPSSLDNSKRKIQVEWKNASEIGRLQGVAMVIFVVTGLLGFLFPPLWSITSVAGLINLIALAIIKERKHKTPPAP